MLRREGGSVTRALTARPFADDAVAFCESVSALLAPLGGPWTAASFFFRRAAVEKMRADLSPHRIARGNVFHVTPGNVPTQFLYSWLLSVLCGNTNVVRVSSKLGEDVRSVIQRIEALARDRIREGNRIVSIAHDDLQLGELSRACDVRVLWGGDDTITRLRQWPLRPDAKEIAFPDRFSLSLVSAAGWDAMDEAAKTRTVRDFVADVWIFDQMACSSPKALVWLGGSRTDFYDRIAAELDRTNVRAALVTAIEKMRFGMGALADERAATVRRISNELVVAETSDLDALRGASWGGGLVVDVAVRSLADVVRLLRPSDQTLTYAGLTSAELDALVEVAETAGICRVVPFGRALAFGRVWDGMDLVEELTRIVVVERERA